MSVEKFGLDPGEKLGFTDDDVVMFATNNFALEKMTKIRDLLQAIERWARSNSNNKSNESLLFEEKGLHCEVLRTAGGGWHKGNFRVRLEFIPENPESFMPDSGSNKTLSPLDDLRSNLDIQPH